MPAATSATGLAIKIFADAVHGAERRKPGQSASEYEMIAAIVLARKGFDQEIVRQTLLSWYQSHSRTTETGHPKHDPNDYAARTTQEAFDYVRTGLSRLERNNAAAQKVPKRTNPGTDFA
jgi:hypothetical protein